MQEDLRGKIMSNLVTAKKKGKYLTEGYNSYVRGFGLDLMAYITTLEERIESLESKLENVKVE